jgi:predicted RNase H-like HicB family nuclease
MTAEVDRYLRLPYAVTITEDTCGDVLCYLAVHPELPGCMAQGETPAAALRNLDVAREDYITALVAMGLDIPLPTSLAPTAHAMLTCAPAQIALGQPTFSMTQISHDDEPAVAVTETRVLDLAGKP